MNLPRSLSLAAGLALSTAAFCRANETFPVVHNQPITVRILSGKNGLPLSSLHLALLGGYDQSDLHDQLYREEVLTDALGNVRLPKQLANLPWLQVWVRKMPLCQSAPRKASFSVELIRRDGLSTPNLCGPVSAQDAPGVFTVFVKNKAPKLKKGVSISVAMPMAPVEAAPPAAPAAITATVVPSPAAQAPLVAAVVPVTSTPSAMPTPPAPVAVPATVIPSTSISAIIPTQTIVHLQSRRVVARRSAHRAKPAPPACSAQTPVSATHHSKPLAGIRVAAKKPAQPASPQKQNQKQD
jgi:hypothetical protein